jgi:hypothetical protein
MGWPRSKEMHICIKENKSNERVGEISNHLSSTTLRGGLIRIDGM